MLDSTELKSKIPGWGIDLDPKNRPGVPREKTSPHGTGAHWDVPDRQIPRVKIYKSSERRSLTPVFGTSCPPKGLSGVLRDYAYSLSEARKSHWFLLIIADRVDEVEGILGSIFQLRPHNPLKEMGLATEFKGEGFRSRFGQHRADVRRMRMEALLVLGLGALLLGRKFIFRNPDKQSTEGLSTDRRKFGRRSSDRQKVA
ncbi:MAG: hypothetical protein ABIQ95_12455 [Bdellovibrionia bacterium]